MTEPQINKDSWIRRHPKLTLMVVVLCLLAGVMGITEVILRKYQSQLNINLESYLLSPDSIELNWENITDEHGILKYSPEARERIQTFLAKKQSEEAFDSLEYSNTGFILFQPIVDYFQAKYDYESPLVSDYPPHIPHYKHFIQNIQNKPDSLWTLHDSLYIQQLNSPINPQGFRSIPFQNHQTEQIKVLLLGDSFTWGAFALPLTNSFGDLLITKGYFVYNSGIIGTDPAQYLSILQTYMDSIQPDVVISNFFWGNDQMDWIRDSEPYTYHIYPTKKGWYQAYLDGCYMSFEESLEVARCFEHYPQKPFLQKSILGILAWRAYFHISNIDCFPNDCTDSIDFNLYTEYYAQQIRQEVEKRGKKHILMMIPDFSGETDVQQFDSTLQSVFTKESYHLPKNLSLEDYRAPDGHFNNQGHEKYANLLDSLIQKQMK